MKRTRLVKERNDKGLKQSDVAAMLGITVRQYQRIEAGLTQGRIGHWDTLEDLFNLPQRQLRETEKKPDGNWPKSDMFRIAQRGAGHKRIPR